MAREPVDLRDAVLAALDTCEVRRLIHVIVDERLRKSAPKQPADDDIAELAYSMTHGGRARSTGAAPAPLRGAAREAFIARVEQEFGWSAVAERWTMHTTAEARSDDREQWLVDVVARLYRRTSGEP